MCRSDSRKADRPVLCPGPAAFPAELLRSIADRLDRSGSSAPCPIRRDFSDVVHRLWGCLLPDDPKPIAMVAVTVVKGVVVSRVVAVSPRAVRRGHHGDF